jgi:rubrerythrin
MDVGSGVISCDGFMERQKVETCASKLPRPEPYPNAPADAQCKSDADCTASPHGWCGNGPNFGGLPGPYCNYGCVQDSECGAGLICLCGDPVGRCVSATCNSDADCQSGFLCKSYDQSRGCNNTTFTCQSPADECGSDADCAGSVSGNLCVIDNTTQHYACAFGGCAIGRPFLVEGSERLASPLRSSDWRGLTPSGLRVAELGGALPARLAREWTRVALMEHASIAAFARFTLQLLSLGAPPELIERATAAMADETKHAKACFALASSYAGEPVGPGPLSVERSLDEMSLVEIVLTTVREGCVGETVAAIEAREASEHATDPQVRELLRTISEDETRHAELAFSFLKWALAGGDAALHAAVRDEFEALHWETESRPSSLDAVECELLQNGVIPRPLRQAIRAGAIADVILPCARALFAPDSAASARDSYRVAS